MPTSSNNHQWAGKMVGKSSKWKKCVRHMCGKESPNDTGCHQVPRLPRQMTPDVTKCHACHAKWHRMSPSATPATPNDTGCHQVPRLQHKQPRATTASNGAQARHQSQPSAISATPATQSEGRCHQVPRLPHPIQNKLSCVCVWVSCVWESCA